MTPFEKLLQFLVVNWRFDLALLGKLAIWLFLLLYIIFSLVVVKQVKVMNRTVDALMNRGLVIFAWLLVALAAAAFIFSLVIL